jgi:hypothetical protein
LTTDPSGTVIVGTDAGSVYVDSGEDGWRALSVQTQGNVNAVAVDPLNPSVVYAVTSSGGVYKSTNRTSFTRMLAGGFLSFAIDPIVTSTLYAGGGPVQKSVDAGVTWTQHTSGLSGSRMTSLIVDPQNSTTLYAATGMVFKSETGGTSWVLSNDGLPSSGTRVLAIDPQTPTTVYAGTFADGVFKSVDGGAHWTPANAGLSNAFVMALAVDPEAPATVYAGTFGAGVFKSTDGGVTWIDLNSGLGSALIRSLALGAESATLFAGTDGAGVFAIATQPATFTLSLSTTGRGPITTVMSPGGSTCGMNCTEAFEAGTTVVLTATPDQGKVVGWTGCDSDTGAGRSSSCTVTMSADREVTVQLNRETKPKPKPEPKPKQTRDHDRRDDDDNHHQARLERAVREWLIQWLRSSR